MQDLMMNNTNDYQEKHSPCISFKLFSAIASATIIFSFISDFIVPSQSVQAVEAKKVIDTKKQPETKVVKIAGTYKTVFTEAFLARSKNAGLASIVGQWTIKPNGKFEAFVTTKTSNGKVRTIKTTGFVSIKNGKVVSQVETIDGKKSSKVLPTQTYTLLTDGKTLQADGQEVKLVRQ